MLLEMKSVLAHRHAQSLMDLVWRGGSPLGSRRMVLPQGFSYPILALHALFPLFLPTSNRGKESISSV